MMKKALLIALLVIMILVLSYVKQQRQEDQQADAFEKGKLEAGTELAGFKNSVDSLKVEMGSKEVTFADSLVRVDQSYQNEISNLSTVVDAKSDTIEVLSGKLKSISTSKTKANTSTSKKLSSELSKKHAQILTYYKKRYKNLPSDLSQYERRIALNEIEEETAQKFIISLTELKKLREQNKLNY